VSLKITVRVKVPRLSLALHTKKFLENLRNELGKFIMIDPTFIYIYFQIVTRLLVEINTKDCLVENLDIVVGHNTHT
jgi:hypothetical protein